MASESTLLKVECALGRLWNDQGDPWVRGNMAEVISTQQRELNAALHHHSDQQPPHHPE